MFEFLLMFTLCYLWHALGVTIGYHRLLSHRSFKCPKAVEYFWVLSGYLAFEGSPIWWSTIHRAHHRYTDTPLDPHSPRYGVKNAYYGWITNKAYLDNINPETECPDLMRDPVYRFLDQGGHWNLTHRHRAHRLCVAAGILFRLGLWGIFGWRIALASTLAGVAVLQIPLLLNVVCHMPRMGYKTYARDDDSVNVWWVALLANGEGWHNNHHAFPGSARSGLKPYELDLSWMMLRVMRSIGLVSSMNEASLADQRRKPQIHFEPNTMASAPFELRQ